MVEPGICEVWWAHPASADASLLALLDDAERARFERFRLTADKFRFLAVSYEHSRPWPWACWDPAVFGRSAG